MAEFVDVRLKNGQSYLSYYFIYLFILQFYLFERQNIREVLDLLIYSINTWKKLVLDQAKWEAKISILVSHVGGRDPSTWTNLGILWILFHQLLSFLPKCFKFLFCCPNFFIPRSLLWATARMPNWVTSWILEPRSLHSCPFFFPAACAASRWMECLQGTEIFMFDSYLARVCLVNANHFGPLIIYEVAVS